MAPRYMDDLIAAELPRAVEAIRIKLVEITSAAAAQNAIGNSRIFIQYQTAILEAVGIYGRMLRERLAQFDAKHSPVSSRDFDRAIASLDELSRQALEIYEKKRENRRPFGDNGLPFDLSRMSAVLMSAKNELRGLRHEHASRRSMLRRWFESGLEAFGKNLVFMLLMIALAFLLGAVFHQPISTVWALIAESGH